MKIQDSFFLIFIAGSRQPVPHSARRRPAGAEPDSAVRSGRLPGGAPRPPPGRPTPRCRGRREAEGDGAPPTPRGRAGAGRGAHRPRASRSGFPSGPPRRSRPRPRWQPTGRGRRAASGGAPSDVASAPRRACRGRCGTHGGQRRRRSPCRRTGPLGAGPGSRRGPGAGPAGARGGRREGRGRGAPGRGRVRDAGSAWRGAAPAGARASWVPRGGPRAPVPVGVPGRGRSRSASAGPASALPLARAAWACASAVRPALHGRSGRARGSKRRRPRATSRDPGAAAAGGRAEAPARVLARPGHVPRLGRVVTKPLKAASWGV